MPINSRALNSSHRKTLDAIFRHPLAHNLEWNDVVALIENIGEVEAKASHEFTFKLAGERRLMHKPHTKDLAGSEVIELRKFLVRAGWSAAGRPHEIAHASATAPDLMVVIDHHDAKIYHFDITSKRTTEHQIKPYDPHHFLHHLVHKDQTREQGQRAPEEPAFYAQIATALASGGNIVVVGHGTGKSNAAQHLSDYLRTHHHDTYQRVVRELVADLSSITTPQLLDLARQALH